MARQPPPRLFTDRLDAAPTAREGGVVRAAAGGGADPSKAHTPKTAEAVRKAARSLLARGFGDHDIAAVLRLDVQQVRWLVGDCEDRQRELTLGR
jgi:hypothetical protein